MIAIQDHGTNESSLETLPLFGAIKRRKFLKICCNLIDTNRDTGTESLVDRLSNPCIEIPLSGRSRRANVSESIKMN